MIDGSNSSFRSPGLIVDQSLFKAGIKLILSILTSWLGRVCKILFIVYAENLRSVISVLIVDLFRLYWLTEGNVSEGSAVI